MNKATVAYSKVGYDHQPVTRQIARAVRFPRSTSNEQFRPQPLGSLKHQRVAWQNQDGATYYRCFYSVVDDRSAIRTPLWKNGEDQEAAAFLFNAMSVKVNRWIRPEIPKMLCRRQMDR